MYYVEQNLLATYTCFKKIQVVFESVYVMKFSTVV